ncbi:MAG: hypothetical protein QGG36_14600 [Pirellulaceae bacterium]|jgi:1,2-phenylacetyl-CoA epoxidase PaaB subunit|nr:hypothetical protein [Pirellulaceae bacterium]MDP6722549.1 hypothetical protein [Pirellulaceae bacterium]MDP7017032.1 hypothetical protein [Pirellulaceae bacterium]
MKKDNNPQWDVFIGNAWVGAVNAADEQAAMAIARTTHGRIGRGLLKVKPSRLVDSQTHSIHLRQAAERPT